MLAVREDRADDELGTPARAQNLGAAKRMILQIGILLVVEVVQQRDDAPHFFVFAERARVPAHRRLDRERMLPQALALGVLGQHVPGIFTRQFERHRLALFVFSSIRFSSISRYSSDGRAALCDSSAISGRGVRRAAIGISLFRSPGIATALPFIMPS